MAIYGTGHYALAYRPKAGFPYSPPSFVPVNESAIGPSRHFAAMQHFGRFRSEADKDRQAERVGLGENDPEATCIPTSFDHLVGRNNQPRRDRQAESLRSL